MEEITEGVNNMNLAVDSIKKNRIQVSNTKKPLFFYVNLAKRYMQQHNEVELSALGMAIATVVTIAEILKNNGLAVEKKIMTSTVDMKDESRGRPVQKAKIEIWLEKTANFDELMAAAAEEREAAGDGEPGFDLLPSSVTVLLPLCFSGCAALGSKLNNFFCFCFPRHGASVHVVKLLQISSFFIPGSVGLAGSCPWRFSFGVLHQLHLVLGSCLMICIGGRRNANIF